MGISDHDYNAMTPYELNVRADVYNEQMVAKSDEALTLVYLGARLERAKQMPDLNKLLSRKIILKPKTDEQMFAEVKRMQKQMEG